MYRAGSPSERAARPTCLRKQRQGSQPLSSEQRRSPVTCQSPFGEQGAHTAL